MKITTAVLASILAMSSTLALAQAGGGTGGGAAGGGAAATGAAGSSGSASSATGTGTTGTNGGNSTTGMNSGAAAGTSPTLSTPGGMPSSVPAPGSTIKR
jgi:hypothetical protein